MDEILNLIESVLRVFLPTLDSCRICYINRDRIMNGTPIFTILLKSMILKVGQFICLLVVVVLLFYVHGKHLRSCRDSQLT